MVISAGLAQVVECSTRLVTSNADVPMLAGIRDWQGVIQHEYWGYRRRPPANSSISPSESLIFLVDVQERVGTLRHLVSGDGAAVTDGLLKDGVSLTLAPAGDGAREARIPFAGDQATLERIFEILSIFGFGVSV
jgi:hypothetical protein